MYLSVGWVFQITTLGIYVDTRIHIAKVQWIISYGVVEKKRSVRFKKESSGVAFVVTCVEKTEDSRGAVT